MKELPSSNAELFRSTEYAEYSDEKLNQLVLDWQPQIESPERSERSQQEVGRILGRLAFERLQRQKEEILLTIDDVLNENVPVDHAANY